MTAPSSGPRASEEALRSVWEKTLPPGEGWEKSDPGKTYRAPEGEASFSGGGTVAPDPDRTRSFDSAPRAAAPRSGRAEEAAALPGYEVLAEIGKGGMGVVHRARQASLGGREVAVKRIRAGRGDASARARFVAEAAATGRLDHPNVVPVHDLGRTGDGDPFLAMKLVDGLSWKELLHPSTDAGRARAAKLDLAAHLRILLAVCNAVAFAHERGIVHRDLKPENVMVGEFGEVLVMDWGLALDLRAAAGGVAAGGAPGREGGTSPMGTPAYMAPELAEGRAQDVGPATDVFLLGAILHEVVTGEAPNRGPTFMAVLLAASKAEPRAYGAEVPEALAAICKRALSREPAARHASAGAFRAAIEEYLAHRESTAISDAAAAIVERCEEPARGVAGSREAERTRLYSDFAEAVAGFKQARLLWAGNPAAEEGERRARTAYAEAALAAGDLGLAAAQAAPLGEGGRGLAARIEAARRARDEAVASARRLRIGLGIAIALIVAGLTIGLAAIRSEQRRTAQALEEILRLADVKRLQDYQEEAAALWPAVPAREQAMRRWLEEAEALRARLPLHARRLEELRARALPYGEAEAKRDRETHPRAGELAALEAERAEKERRLSEARRAPSPDTATAEEMAGLESDLTRIARREEELDGEVRARRTWAFPDREAQWEHDTVAALVAGLEALSAEGLVGDTIPGVRARAAFARSVRERSLEGAAGEAWARAVAEIAASPLYGGLRVRPQLGLVPLGKDPRSGLQEFAHLETGAVPKRGPDGKLLLGDETAIVFVLLPGGRFRQGAVKPEGAAEGETNTDPDALENEAPVTEVALAPFFISKYEMTQGQWLRATGANPAQYGPGATYGDKTITLLCALENVSWEEASAVAGRLGLALPTEAQWEYACRAGTTTPYWTGAAVETLAGAANVADRFARDNGGVATGAYEPWLDDGYRVEAPAGTYRENGFGLEGMTGGVLEWCADAMGSYRNRPREGDGLRAGDGEGTFVHRGGNWFNTASSCRSAIRDADSQESKWDSRGFRAARRLAAD